MAPYMGFWRTLGYVLVGLVGVPVVAIHYAACRMVARITGKPIESGWSRLDPKPRHPDA